MEVRCGAPFQEIAARSITTSPSLQLVDVLVAALMKILCILSLPSSAKTAPISESVTTQVQLRRFVEDRHVVPTGAAALNTGTPRTETAEPLCRPA